MIKISPSDEQKKIIETITAGKNVVVDAVAGSGKTSTLIFIALKNKHKKILQITYNKQLKIEVRDKIQEHDLSNVEVQTYHSLAVKFYDEKCYTDDGLINILKQNKRLRWVPQYDIIAIDETQDMTPNYYELVCKFMRDVSFKKSLLILGDHFQGVYEFKNADTRYLLLSHKLWDKNFNQLTLNESYRVTTQIASFVNKIMIGYDRIIANKKGDHKVYYYKTNTFDSADGMFQKIQNFLKSGYKPEDIFILSPSLKSTDNPGKKLENLLVKNNIPVFFTRNEEEGIDEKVIAGKIVFTTFHQAKGRERKIVFVYGFDESYFDFFAKDKNRNHCPPELYVAITRSSEILIVIEDSKYGPLSFLKKPPCQLKKYAFIEYLDDKPAKKNKTIKQEKNKNTHKTTVKDLTMYLSEVTMSEISPIINMLFTTVCPKQDKFTVDIPLTIETKNKLIEDVSDLNGIVIPAIYETKFMPKNIKSSLQNIIEQSTQNIADENNVLIRKKMSELITYPDESIQKYLLMGNLFIAVTENIFSKLNQIDRYDWLSQAMINICHQNLAFNVKGNATYEQVIHDNYKNYYTYNHDVYGEINVCGRIDAHDNDTVWEFKCVSSLHMEHLLQLVIYAWLWEKCMKDTYGSKKYKILNIRTGEVQEMKYQDHLIEEIIELILINKYDPKFRDDDIIFLERCEKVRKNYLPYNDDIFSMFGPDD